MKKTSLVIMAAGVEAVLAAESSKLPGWSSGEIIMDYSILMLWKRVLKKLFLSSEKIWRKILRRSSETGSEKIAPVEYAYQEMDDLPEGFSVPEGRKKPWGNRSGDSCGERSDQESFLVINADDFYGKEGFKIVHDYMVK